VLYVPDRGHVAWLTFDQTAGHEQGGKRPALVLTPAKANSVLGLAIFCPITSKGKGYPFEVAFPPGLKIAGVVLVDQIRSFDWKARSPEYICTATNTVMNEVAEKLRVLLPFDPVSN